MNERLRADWQLPDNRKPLDVPSFAERFFGTAVYRPPQPEE
jgi:hypothetical protein